MQQILIHEIIVSVTNCFIEAKIPFCVAGGIAVSLWGHIRATEDDGLLATNDFLKQCIQNSKIFTLSGISIPVICIEDLIVMKCASGRHQDIADIQSLLAASLPVDKSYINSQIQKLNIAIPEEVKALIWQ